MADFHKKIAKAIKAKGLQKLKHWCELCHKQCRDANGFKMHCATEAHLRQVAIFDSNPGAFLDQFSQDFQTAFMELMRRRWRFKDILAKKAWNEYIQDKEHVHMNATRWVTLTDFVKYLGKAGLCTVWESDEGWMLRYVDRDPEREAHQAAMRAREKGELEQKDIEVKKMLKQVKEMERRSLIDTMEEANGELEEDELDGEGYEHNTVDSEGSNELGDEKTETKDPDSKNVAALNSQPTSSISVTLSSPLTIPMVPVKDLDKKRPLSSLSTVQNQPVLSNKQSKLVSDSTPKSPSLFSASTTQQNNILATNIPSFSSSSSIDSLMEEQEKKREQQGRKPYWLHPHIVVKIKNKEVGNGKYYGQKAEVIDIADHYTATVVVLESNAKLRLDQDELETVIPALKSNVMIVNGAYRGEIAILQSIDYNSFTANVTIAAGVSRGRQLTKAYEDICKIAEH